MKEKTISTAPTMTIDEFVNSLSCLIRTAGGQLYGPRDYCAETHEEITSWGDCLKCQGIDPKEVDFDA